VTSSVLSDATARHAEALRSLGLDRYTHLHQTSGTTGPPLYVLDTAEDWMLLSDATHAGRLQETIRQRIGLRVRIIPVAPGTLPPSDGGKTRRVVDQRARNWMP
jgi:phenylacetate-coenzyme A ligase PaaK-like adenylate-forming protein